MRALIVLVLLLAVFPAHAQNKAVTCKGKIGIGTLDSGIHGLANDCDWLTGSQFDALIFKECNSNDDCEVTGIVDDNDFLVSMSKVRKIDASSEPPANLIKEAACMASPIASERCGSMVMSIKIHELSSAEAVHDEFCLRKYNVNMVYDGSVGDPVTFEKLQFSIYKRNGVWVYIKIND